PRLWSRALPMYFIVRPVAAAQMGRRPLVVTPSPSTVSRSPARGNEVRVGLDTLGRFRASVYLGGETTRNLTTLARTASLRGLRFLLNRLTLSGQTSLINLLSKLRVPRYLARPIARLLLRLAMIFLARA